MATKLDLTLTASPPEGDHALICLVGSKGALIPKLDKDLAAAVISAMSTARFTGEAGKSATLNLPPRNYHMIVHKERPPNNAEKALIQLIGENS